MDQDLSDADYACENAVFDDVRDGVAGADGDVAVDDDVEVDVVAEADLANKALFETHDAGYARSHRTHFFFYPWCGCRIEQFAKRDADLPQCVEDNDC